MGATASAPILDRALSTACRMAGFWASRHAIRSRTHGDAEGPSWHNASTAASSVFSSAVVHPSTTAMFSSMSPPTCSAARPPPVRTTRNTNVSFGIFDISAFLVFEFLVEPPPNLPGSSKARLGLSTSAAREWGAFLPVRSAGRPAAYRPASTWASVSWSTPALRLSPCNSFGQSSTSSVFSAPPRPTTVGTDSDTSLKP